MKISLFALMLCLALYIAFTHSARLVGACAASGILSYSLMTFDVVDFEDCSDYERRSCSIDWRKLVLWR